MKIYFRACEKQETISYVQRRNNEDKSTILKKCWLSLQQSMTDEDNIVIFHDEVSQETLNFIEQTCKAGIYSFYKIPEHDFDYHLHTVEVVNFLEEDIKNSNPRETIYLVEDDYLFHPNALNILNETMKYWGHFSVLQDYPDRYKNPKPSQIFVGTDRHWRTIDSCTMTIAAHACTWEKYIGKLKEAAPTSNDKIFEEIFLTSPCISPMPGLASHLTPYHMTPYTDWDSIWSTLNVNN